MALQLPHGITLESLYQINDQSIWFLIWILKKERFWLDLNREVLEIPFTVKKNYYFNGQIMYLKTQKNNIYHGIIRYWCGNGQLSFEEYWKNGKLDGINRGWSKNGQLRSEYYLKDGERDGIDLGWYESGQLWWEQPWKNGLLNGIQREWCENGQLLLEKHWKNGHKIYEKEYEQSLFLRKITFSKEKNEKN